MGGTLLSQDVPPYVRAVSKGGMAFPNGINSEGLKEKRLYCASNQRYQEWLQDYIYER